MDIVECLSTFSTLLGLLCPIVLKTSVIGSKNVVGRWECRIHVAIFLGIEIVFREEFVLDIQTVLGMKIVFGIKNRDFVSIM